MPDAAAAPLITLMTDFGTSDHYVGVMKGVIAAICPAARVIDISHEIEPFQIAQGAYLLSQSWRWFPERTIHVAVIDPGVGSRRRAIAATVGGHCFVLPDNGLLSLVASAATPCVREIRDDSLFLRPLSNTFHGRDIFAPVAAHIARGRQFESVGPEIGDWVRLETEGRPSVLHIDRFGNIVTSLTPDLLRNGQVVQLGGHRISRVVSSYDAAGPGEIFAILGSSGYIEISMKQSSAAALIGCRVGDPATVSAAGRS